MAKFSVIDIDFSCNVAFTDGGHILEIENYVDEDENPCLPEEAIAVYVKVGTTKFERFEIQGDD